LSGTRGANLSTQQKNDVTVFQSAQPLFGGAQSSYVSIRNGSAVATDSANALRASTLGLPTYSAVIPAVLWRFSFRRCLCPTRAVCQRPSSRVQRPTSCPFRLRQQFRPGDSANAAFPPAPQACRAVHGQKDRDDPARATPAFPELSALARRHGWRGPLESRPPCFHATISVRLHPRRFRGRCSPTTLPAAHRQSSEKPLLIPVVAGAEQGDTFTPFRPWVRMHETQTHHRPGVDGDVERAGYVIGGDLQCARRGHDLADPRPDHIPDNDGCAQGTDTGRVSTNAHASAGACALSLLTISRHVTPVRRDMNLIGTAYKRKWSSFMRPRPSAIFGVLETPDAMRIMVNQSVRASDSTGTLSHKCHENSRTATFPRAEPVTKFSVRDARVHINAISHRVWTQQLYVDGNDKNESSGAASGKLNGARKPRRLS